MRKSRHPEKVQPTYKSQLAAALKDDPDILFCASYPGHTTTSLKESRDVLDFTTWLFVDGNKSTKVVESVGADTLAGSLGTAPGTDTDSKAYKDFKSAYMLEYDRNRIPPFPTSAYNAAVTIGSAMARAVANGASEFAGPVLRNHLRPVCNPPGDTVTGGSAAWACSPKRSSNQQVAGASRSVSSARAASVSCSVRDMGLSHPDRAGRPPGRSTANHPCPRTGSRRWRARSPGGPSAARPWRSARP